MTRTLYPPQPVPWDTLTTTLFLAGSIEQDRAEPWQARVAQALHGRDLTLLNPRRDAWDADWRQDIDDPDFRAQVEWELEGLERASWVLVYFDPRTRSPITLLELGLLAASRPRTLCVACPEGFWRRGNIQIVCQRYQIPLLDSLDELIQYISNSI